MVPGIILGMLLSLIGVLVEISRPQDAVLRRVAGDGKFHDMGQQSTEGETVPGLLVYRLYAPLIFANAADVGGRPRELADTADPPLKWLIIDAQAITEIDLTAAECLAALIDELAQRALSSRLPMHHDRSAKK